MHGLQRNKEESMRKLIVLIIILLVGTAYAVINDPLTTSLTSSTWVAVNVPNGQLQQNRCLSVITKTHDGSAFYVSSSSTGSPYMTIPADTSFELGCVYPTGNTIFYAQSDSATADLQTLVSPSK